MSGTRAVAIGDSGLCEGPAEARALLLEQLDVIDGIVAAVCRRWRFTAEQAEDFNGQVRLHLIRRNYQVLRRFRGGSQLTTYLTRVISNLARDHLAREQGRFRASRVARRLGLEAVELERLIYREARGHEEAIQIVLRQRPKARRHELEALIARLPVRFPRRTIPLDSLDRPWLDTTSDDRLSDEDRGRFRRRLRACLGEATARLTPQDRLLLQLRFVEGYSVAEVARKLDLDQRSLYPRFVRILSSMRCCLEAGGFSWHDVKEIVGWDSPSSSLEPAELEKLEVPASAHQVSGD